VYDPATGAFSATSNSMIAARQGHHAILLPHNSQVLFVGGTAGGNAVAGAEVYVEWQGNGGTFYPRTAPGTARAWSVAAALSFQPGLTIRTGPNDGLMLLAGGSAKADASEAVKSAELYGFATVKTDLADYHPGQVVTITGSGWQPNETVSLAMIEVPFHDAHALQPVLADGSGNIISTEFIPDVDDIGIRFYITVLGSQSQAQTSFTDVARAWTGAVSTEWNLAGNWSGGIPTSADDVTIPPALTNYPVVSTAAANAKTVTLTTGAGAQPTLTVSANTLTVAGNFSVNAGTVTHSGGTIAVTAGVVSITGTVNESAGTFLISSTNTMTVNSGGNANVSGTGVVHMASALATAPTGAIIVSS
jgi:hypothetical protein